MTTYMPDDEIYSREMNEMLSFGKSVAVVLDEIHETRKRARQARSEVRQPGFRSPVVSYIPAYGAEVTIQAMIDYCRLKRIMDKSEGFSVSFNTKLECPLRFQCSALTPLERAQRDQQLLDQLDAE